MLSSLSYAAGIGGALLSCAAYVPQIVHLMQEKCSAGLSVKAFIVWFVAAGLLLFHAMSIRSLVFIILQMGNLFTCALIVFFGYKYRKRVCTMHKSMRTL